MHRGISERVPHTYKVKDLRYYGIYRATESVIMPGDPEQPPLDPSEIHLYQAVSFYLIDQHGYCWIELTNVAPGLIKKAFGGIFTNGYKSHRPILYIDDPHWERSPRTYKNQDILTLTRGHPILHDALEIVEDWLGLELVYMMKGVRAKVESEEAVSDV